MFSDFIDATKPNIAELLSKYVGDVVSHTLVSTTKQAASFLKNTLNGTKNHASEVMIHEYRLLPSALEVAAFCDQSQELKIDVDVLSDRIQKLLEK